MGQTSRGIVYPSNYSAVADVPADLQIMAQSIDDILQEDEQNIQNNSDDIATIQENVSAHEQSIQDNTTDINTLKNQVQSFALVSETGNKVGIEINSLTYVMKIILKDKNNNVINTSNEIDLPLETMVVGARYDSSTKELVLTLKNGQETRFSIADLIDGLVSQSDFDDLVEIVGANTETIENNTSAIANNMKDIKQNEEDIDDITKLIDTEFDTNTAEGTTIDVDDSAEWDGSIGVGGNTSQKQLSGKNLINTFAQKSTSIEGITVSVDDDGIVTLNGTCTKTNTGIDLSQVLVGDGKMYTLKAEIISGTYSKPSNDLRFNFHILSSAYNYEGLSQQFGETEDIKRALIDGHEYDTIGFRVDSGIVLNNVKVRIQLEQGSTATEYEQYCGGQPSPNPNYTQEIKVVTGDNVVKHVGKNQLNIVTQTTSQGITSTKNSDGSVRMAGTTETTWFNITDSVNKAPICIKKGRQFIFSINTNFNFIIQLRLYEKDSKKNKNIIIPIGQTSVSFTAEADYDTYFIFAYNGQAGTAIDTTLKFQIEEGSTPTPYEPYRGEDYNLNLGTMELCKIGDYKDILFKNVVGDENYNAELEEGTWYKKRVINKINPNSSDNWQIQSINSNGFVNFRTFRLNDYIWVQSSNNRSKSICNAFMYDGSLIANVIKEGFMLTDSQTLLIRISQNRLKTIEELKKFLDENKVVIYYIMKDAVYEKITDPTLISQLETLLKVQTYHGVNHFYVETDNLEPNMELTYKQSNKIQMQKEIEDLKNAIISMGGNV